MCSVPGKNESICSISFGCYAELEVPKYIVFRITHLTTQNENQQHTCYSCSGNKNDGLAEYLCCAVLEDHRCMCGWFSINRGKQMHSVNTIIVWEDQWMFVDDTASQKLSYQLLRAICRWQDLSIPKQRNTSIVHSRTRVDHRNRTRQNG